MRASVLEANDLVLDANFEAARNSLKACINGLNNSIVEFNSLASSEGNEILMIYKGKKVNAEVYERINKYEHETLKYVETNLAYCLLQNGEFKELWKF
jgi:hypothetical protein